MPSLNNSRQPPQAPAQFIESSAAIIADMKQLIEHSRVDTDKLVQTTSLKTVTFTKFIVPLTQIDTKLLLLSRKFNIYKELSSEKELREAGETAANLLADYKFEHYNRRDVFELVDTVMGRKESLDAECQTVLKMQHKEFIRKGVHLTTEKRARLKEIHDRSTEIRAEFWKIPDNQDSCVLFTTEELEGVPDDVVARFKKEEAGDKIRLKVPYKSWTSGPMLSRATRGETRKRYWHEWPQYPERREAIFKEIVMLKHEAACLLGYANNAAYRIDDRVAESPEEVWAFLNDLREKLLPSGMEELKPLRDVKKQDFEARHETYEGRFYDWDKDYYANMSKPMTKSASQEKVMEYYALEETVNGMLEIFGDLLGLAFAEFLGAERKKIALWQQDVQIFSVWESEERGSDFLGYLCLDLYERENKYHGYSEFNVQPVSQNDTGDCTIHS